MPKSGRRSPPNLRPPLPRPPKEPWKSLPSTKEPRRRPSMSRSKRTYTGTIPRAMLAPWELPGEAIMESKTPKIARVLYWKSGPYVVVQGPFPDLLFRSETRDSPEKAAKLSTSEMWGRDATTREDQYAKVLLKDVLPIEAGENEFGPVSP